MDFYAPTAIARIGTDLYVNDSNHYLIRKIAVSGAYPVTTIAGDTNPGYADHATGTSARFAGDGGLTTDGTDLFFADRFNCTIRKITVATGAVTTFAGAGPGTMGT